MLSRLSVKLLHLMKNEMPYRNVSTVVNEVKHHSLQEAALKENCILVDINDKPTGYASKKDCHLVDEEGKIKLHRAFSVFLFNTKGEMLVQRRSIHKITFPDTYTNACCSHPVYDFEEERDEMNAIGIKKAAQRRLNYELGVPLEQAQPDDFKYLTRIYYENSGDGIWGEHEIDYILFLCKDVDISPNPNEISEIRYIKRENLNNELSSFKAPLTPWFHLILKYHLRQWWDNLHRLNDFQDFKTIHKLS